MNKILLTIHILAALTRPTVLDTCLEMRKEGLDIANEENLDSYLNTKFGDYNWFQSLRFDY